MRTLYIAVRIFKRFIFNGFISCFSVNSYEQALQALADSEARRETSDKEMKLVS